MITSYSNGNPIIYDELTKEWLNADDKTPIISNPRTCPKCGHHQTKEGHDHCIANLPGVIHACCSHGVEEGYIVFENGTTIRGIFEIG